MAGYPLLGAAGRPAGSGVGGARPVRFHRAGTSQAPGRGETGETLVETLITVILMGLAVVGLLVGLLSVARMADHNNRVTHVGNTAQSYAEQLKQPVAEMEYRDCASSTDYPDLSGNLPAAAYEVRVADVQYASGTPIGDAASITWSGSCPAGGDVGLQMLTVEVEVTRESQTTRERISIVKRDARCEYYEGYDNPDRGPC